MNKLKLLALPILALLFLSSCSSVRVLSDYDQKADFNGYKSYAFYKTGIDKAQISDLDKKRILRAIETEMASRGFVKSENPDILVSIFTKEQERVDVYNNNFGWGGWGGFGGWGWGWGGLGWGPGLGWGWGGGNLVSTSTEGSLYIDLIDTKSKELVWQGKGEGTLANTKNIQKKEQRIQQFVAQILEQYPPDALVSK
ncbi:DUF4136 domain-containing protein [Maribacter sp. MJ134]|jgi:hypothetical protein|uniref:DUF4136 domain-containing protein n=1 Tax=unclassified Maribacter TaxID=2615042 RepID=UPI000C1552FF|nr:MULTISPECIES: DUF4136 domain-containing protein [unclassified Maribacter]AZQ60393.1 DUF4136 domain-containing protein [Maribacter sp. MJ134]PIB30489.1 hypothetical protein BFP77_04375 [Maribacter sp. 4U21]